MTSKQPLIWQQPKQPQVVKVQAKAPFVSNALLNQHTHTWQLTQSSTN
ncbi:hypothetical protein RA086_06895 [Lactiplantibacillus sp. WILCCON 0030]|uniref:Uncharacterized protein n=1 Tax=Lactiplantibacillus brownii TaxID=3069269 RepID=A0ABU1AAC5_9LACO|nr:hypothetical protein [Lactiplantibacillus brownii]MDQ7937353.1 hypothetical protein [Lactiplantibacillus brownii]